MRLIRTQKPRQEGHPFVFHIAKREQELLLATLRLYPMLDTRYHRLSRTPRSTGKADQQWLEETMEQQQGEHEKKLIRLFRNEQRFFQPDKHGLRLSLTGEEIEWMLRVLNDIRVGSWVRLGCPEMEEARAMALTAEQVRYLASMELSGYFQGALLQAVS